MIDAKERQHDEDATARLLRIAGPRAEVPADRSARVQRAVHLQWKAATRRRVVRQRMVAATALLATAAALVLVVRLATSREAVVAPLGEIVATLERLEGEARLVRPSLENAGDRPRSRDASAVATRLSPEDTVRTGEWVETNATSRAALRLADGTSVRLDTGARARLLSSTVIELSDGALYVDTGQHSTGGLGQLFGEPERRAQRAESGSAVKSGLEVRTPFGTAHDIGTQFEIRLLDPNARAGGSGRGSSLRIRVRTGVVELRHLGQAIAARAGTELDVAADEVASRTVSAYGPEWEWAASLARDFNIEGQPLAAFLAHLSREQGWTLRYADAGLAREASGIILSGSISGLQPQEALAVALTTSGLDHRLRDGELAVFRAANAK